MSGPIAYILAEFPSLSETFILREMIELRHCGVQLVIFALRAAPSHRVHERARELIPITHYRPPLLSLPTVADACYFLARRPLRLSSCLGMALRQPWPGTFETLRRLRHVFTACSFARACGRLGVRQIHAHFANLPAEIAMAMAQLTGLKFSISTHAGDIHLQDRRRLCAKLDRAAFVTVCCRAHVELVAGLSPTPVELIYHGIDPGEYSPPWPEPGLILAVGRLEEKKGFTVLLEALALLTRRGVACRSIIAGEGRLRFQLEERVRTLGLQERVEFAGEQSERQVERLLRRASVFAWPSVVARNGDRDGLSNVLLEAMAARLPIVASRVGAVEELVRDGENGLLAEPGNAGDLADKLALLLADAGLRARLGAAGRATVERNFDIRQWIPKLAAHFI